MSFILRVPFRCSGPISCSKLGQISETSLKVEAGHSSKRTMDRMMSKIASLGQTPTSMKVKR